MNRPGLTAEELNKFTDEARRRYYLRGSYMLSKVIQAITHPREAPRIAKGSLTLIKYIFKQYS